MTPGVAPHAAELKKHRVPTETTATVPSGKYFVPSVLRIPEYPLNPAVASLFIVDMATTRTALSTETGLNLRVYAN